jgi:hypothetical protein
MINLYPLKNTTPPSRKIKMTYYKHTLNELDRMYQEDKTAIIYNQDDITNILSFKQIKDPSITAIYIVYDHEDDIKAFYYSFAIAPYLITASYYHQKYFTE